MRPTGLTRQKRRKKTRLPRKRFFFLLALVLCILVLLVGMRFLGSFQALQNRADWAKELRQAPQTAGTNYLLYGITRSGEKVTVKEIFFLNYPEQGTSFHTLFIPGKVLLHRLTNENDAGQPLGGGNNEGSEVRSFYTPDHFYQEGGARLLIQQISFFLDTPIHHYLEFDYSGVPVLSDTHEELFFQGDVLKDRGELLEDGEPLEEALRRISFWGELLKLLTEKKGKLNLYRMIGGVAPYFETDLTWKELRIFQKDLEPFFRAEGLMVSLPGDWREFDGEYFLEPDSMQLAALSGSLGGDFILPRELITVEVLNGCGAVGVASTAGSILEEQGFRVVKVDNADNFEYQRSQVISRLEQVEPAKEVALFIPEAELFKEPRPDHTAMVTVIIGKNFSP